MYYNYYYAHRYGISYLHIYINILTVHTQGGPSFELYSFDHGPVPHHAPVHRAIVLPTGRHLQNGRRDRLFVVGADPSHGFDRIAHVFAVPSDHGVRAASGARAGQFQRASLGGHRVWSGSDLRRAGRRQHGDLKALRMDFPTGAGRLQATLEFPVVPLVRRVGNE